MRVLASLVLLSSALLGQDASFKIDVQLVRLLVSVKNAGGDLIGTLDKSDFTVFDKDVQQEIAIFEHQTTQPLSVTLLIDTSGVGGEPQSFTEAYEEAFSCANRGSAEYRTKLMEIARHNANSAFDLAREMFEVRTFPELMELALDYQRKQFETTATHMKELSALTQKVVTETTEPIRSGMAEPFKIAS